MKYRYGTDGKFEHSKSSDLIIVHERIVQENTKIGKDVEYYSLIRTANDIWGKYNFISWSITRYKCIGGYVWIIIDLLLISKLHARFRKRCFKIDTSTHKCKHYQTKDDKEDYSRDNYTRCCRWTFQRTTEASESNLFF